MMVRSTTSSNQRPDTLMQDRSRQIDENLLQRTAGPYIGVKLRRTQCEQMSSGLPLTADIAQYSVHVSKVQKPEVPKMSFLDPRGTKKKDRLAAVSPSLTDA